ncbi:hypothetical protein IMSAGC016_01484 [Muribaculaceae bacterium]|nr:hypothetical protein IMSAGC016_01484 [Muribaculaceae bacterium]
MQDVALYSEGKHLEQSLGKSKKLFKFNSNFFI